MSEIKWNRRQWKDGDTIHEERWACYPDGPHAGYLWKRQRLEDGKLMEERELCYKCDDGTVRGTEGEGALLIRIRTVRSGQGIWYRKVSGIPLLTVPASWAGLLVDLAANLIDMAFGAGMYFDYDPRTGRSGERQWVLGRCRTALTEWKHGQLPRSQFRTVTLKPSEVQECKC